MKLSAIFASMILTANTFSPAVTPVAPAARESISVPEAITSSAPASARIAEGVVKNFTYIDELDVMKCEIETHDGHVWFVLDYVAPRETDVIVTFDTMGTEDVEDDEIIEIVSICEFARFS